MRQFNTAAPASPAARKKMRIAGAVIGAAVLIDLVATVLFGFGGVSRSAVGWTFGFGAGLLLVGIVYVFLNRKAR